jgi:predicted glutamine amidotransferase
MCGIYAVVKKKGVFNNKSYNSLLDLAMLSTLRGTDGAGMVAVKEKDGIDWMKSHANILHLMQDNKWDAFEESLRKSLIAFGHARAATRGGISTDNSHPFVKDHIALVHNGTLDYSYWNTLNKDYKAFVDSHTICQALADEPNAVKVLEDLKGAYALIWNNERTNTLNVARNTERPLFWLRTEDHIYFASERDMITAVLKKNKIDFNPKNIEMVESGVLHSFETSNLSVYYRSKFKVRDNWENTHQYGGKKTYRYDHETNDWREKDTSAKPKGIEIIPPNKQLTVVEDKSTVIKEREQSRGVESCLPGYVWGDLMCMDVIEYQELGENSELVRVIGVNELYDDAIIIGWVPKLGGKYVAAEVIIGKPCVIRTIGDDPKAEFPKFKYMVSLGHKKTLTPPEVFEILNGAVTDDIDEALIKYHNATKKEVKQNPIEPQDEAA